MLPADMLARELRRDGSRPLVTWYDDATGERVELSVATAANWAAKVAGLLVEDHDIGPGHAVGVQLPLHWETFVVLLGIWSTGAAVVAGGSGDVTFTSRRTGLASGAQIALALAPLGGDFSRMVAPYPDVFVPMGRLDPQAPALVVDGRMWTQEALADSAVDAARAHGLDTSARVLSTLGYDTVDGLDTGLLVPLAAGGSIVLVSNLDQSTVTERCRAERVTHTAGVAVDGLDRLSRAG